MLSYIVITAISSWHTVMRMKCPKRSPCDPIGPSDLPHSLHAFHRVPKTDPQDMVSIVEVD
jgi:diacylglycerol kinase (ATP)